MTSDQFELMKIAAERVLDDVERGRHRDPSSVAWAAWVVRQDAHQGGLPDDAKLLSHYDKTVACFKKRKTALLKVVSNSEQPAESVPQAKV